MPTPASPAQRRVLRRGSKALRTSDHARERLPCTATAAGSNRLGRVSCGNIKEPAANEACSGSVPVEIAAIVDGAPLKTAASAEARSASVATSWSLQLGAGILERKTGFEPATLTLAR